MTKKPLPDEERIRIRQDITLQLQRLNGQAAMAEDAGNDAMLLYLHRRVTRLSADCQRAAGVDVGVSE